MSKIVLRFATALALVSVAVAGAVSGAVPGAVSAAVSGAVSGGAVPGAVLAAVPGAVPPQVRSSCTVERIVDGDTFVCEGGERIRLLLVDTPEMNDEPLGRLAREFVAQVLPPGTEVRLEIGVQERDRYGRLLAYVELPDGRMLNRVVAREGYAQVMVVPPNVEHVERIRAAVDSARREGVGLWRRQGFGREDPPDPRTERPERTDRSPGQRDPEDCHPSYPRVCIPPSPPDLDCGEIDHRRFSVVGGDPHRFDGDDDGIGCESSGASLG